MAENPLLALPHVDTDRLRVEDELRAAVTAPTEALTEMAGHLIGAGGKRVRPLFAVAAAACGDGGGSPATLDVIRGGVSVELVHLGSLYHDDVIDEATTRRGVESVNSRWGNLRAILAGDFLLARASELAASLGVEVAGLLANTIGRLCAGQLLELQHAFDLGRTEDLYLRSIDGKTASLLASSCRIGGIVAELPRDQIDALTTFGHSYGMAFQIVDDVLDLVSSEADMGKPVGHDIEEGVYTLPVLYSLDGAHGVELRSMLGGPVEPDARDRAAEIVRDGDGIDRAIARANQFAAEGRAALAMLPDSPGVVGLSAAADYLLDSVEAAAA
jgi:heptaprenyl diphosphate synthase